MASKASKVAKKNAAIESMFRGTALEDVVSRCEKTLSIPIMNRKPEIASVTAFKCAVKTARATSHRAKKPFVINK